MAGLLDEPYIGYPQLARRRAVPNTDVETSKGLLRGISYYPYDLLGAPIDLMNMAITPLGMGSKTPVMGSEYLQGLAQKAGLSLPKTDSSSENIGRILSSIINPAAGARAVGKVIDPAMQAVTSVVAPLGRAMGEQARVTENVLQTPAMMPTVLPNVTEDLANQLNKLGTPNEKQVFTTKETNGIFEVEPTSSFGFSQPLFGKGTNEGVYPGTAISTRGVGSSVYGIDEQEANRQIRSILATPETNKALQVANQVTESFGRNYNPKIDIPSSSLSKQSGIARTYQIAAEFPDKYPKQQVFESYLSDPEYGTLIKELGIKNYDDLVEASYKQLEKETQQQFKSLPVKMSYHEGSLNYNNSDEMLRDILGHNNLTVFRGGEKHDFLNKIDPQTGLNSNDQFRAVHDYFGHAIKGNPFGAKGEEIAWASHEQMYSPLAKIAMTSETRGQNSFVNYSPINAELYSKMETIRKMQNEARAKGDTDFVQDAANELRKLGSEWGYAKQSSLILPAEYTKTQFAGGMPDYLINAVEPKFGTQEILTHYSNKPDLGFLDPNMYGTGIRGQEARRLQETVNPVQNRSYAYRGAIGEVTPEPGLGKYPYQMQATNLYDRSADLEKLNLLSTVRNTQSNLSPYNRGLLDSQQKLTDLERLTKEYGYSGLLDPDKAVLFNRTPLR
jgi:hypothetical protein